MTIGVTDHAQARAYERLGRNLTHSEWLAVVAAITARRAALLRRQDAREVYAVALGGIVLRVVWEPHQAMVVTLLPTSPTAYRPKRPPRHIRGAEHA
jgi:hypothetical protein